MLAMEMHVRKYLITRIIHPIWTGTIAYTALANVYLVGQAFSILTFDSERMVNAVRFA